MKRRAAVTLAALMLVGCGSDDRGSLDPPAVSGAWARASAPGQTSGAVYFELEAGADDRLLAASVPDTVADGVEIHETVQATIEGGSSEASVMREVTEGIALTAGERVSFSPGGHHVMLVDLDGPLSVGEAFDLTLEFDHADPVTFSVVVAETAP
jgi:copper(I)-binding protein